MTPQGAKAKGRRLQQAVRDMILARYPQLEPDDVRSTGMGQGGEDIQLSPAARRCFPFAIECKARGNIKTLYAWLAQAKAHGTGQPLLVLKGDRERPVVVLDAEYFLDLIAYGK